MRELTSKTQKVGIIGWPVTHSASPRIHNAAFAASGLDFIYLFLPATPELISQAVPGLKALGFSGANVTIPHKVSIMPFLDGLAECAKLAGAVNTIVVKEGRAVGYNTDLTGFMQSLGNENIDVASKKIVVLGAGGACRAVTAAFLKHGASDVAVLARDGLKAADFAGIFSGIGRVTGYDWAEPVCREIFAEADILVNTTPLGMSPDYGSLPPIRWEVLKRQAVFVDLIYNPEVTAFMKEAMKRGHKAINGEGMLIEQAVSAFALWTGLMPSRDVMYQAFKQGKS